MSRTPLAAASPVVQTLRRQGVSIDTDGRLSTESHPHMINR